METPNSVRIKKFDRRQLKRSFSSINWNPSGKVCDVVGTVIEAVLPNCSLGHIVNIGDSSEKELLAEVVGFREDKTLLLPFGDLHGIGPGTIVTGNRFLSKICAGDFLLGKVIDPMGRPLGQPFSMPDKFDSVPLESDAPDPMSRQRIGNQLSMGVRAIDGVLSFGEGQRVGVMAGSGVGKSVLMGMVARGSSADVNIIGLIGERGREVREFLERDLGPEGLKRSVVVCSTGDQSPLVRLRAAKVVVALAEYFSRKGKRVLVMMDSVTRVAMAQREIGLAIGEPPTAKGYPPSVFSLLPRLLERCGPQPENCGSISALFTVLVDGDDFNDPIPDAVRAIVDGHINLSRDLAAQGHFPAIDVTTSVSRVMHDIVPKEHWNCALMLKSLLAEYNENHDLIQLGSYKPGTNPRLDVAINLMPQILNYLRQDITDKSTSVEAYAELKRIVSSIQA